MAQIIISNPEVKIDGDIIGKVPNTVTVMTGSGEASVNAVAVGEGSTDIVVSRNVETNVSSVKFEVWSTYETMINIDSYKTRIGSMLLTVTGDDSKGNVLSYAFRNMTLVTHPEYALQNEGKISLEFKGNKAI